MASRVHDVFDMMDKNSADKAVSTLSGVHNLKIDMENLFLENDVEDDISIVRSIDVSYVEEMIKEDEYFDPKYVSINVLPKINVNNVPIRFVNNKLKECLILNDWDLLFSQGYKNDDRFYHIPIVNIKDHNKIFKSRLTFIDNNGNLDYVTMKDYTSPSITFFFEERSEGKQLTEIIYKKLKEIQNSN